MIEYIVSPEELFFLGTLLQAKYIDYAYIAAMDDIQDNFPLHKKEAVSSLVKKGYVQEDFSGDLEVLSELKSVINPVFFGTIESSLDVCYLGDNKYVDIFKFHHNNETITMVSGKDKELVIKSVDMHNILDLLNEIIRNEMDNNADIKSELDSNEITRIIAVKNSVVSGDSIVKTFFEVGNHLYNEKEDETLSAVTKSEFIHEAETILRGETNGI